MEHPWVSLGFTFLPLLFFFPFSLFSPYLPHTQVFPACYGRSHGLVQLGWAKLCKALYGRQSTYH